MTDTTAPAAADQLPGVDSSRSVRAVMEELLTVEARKLALGARAADLRGLLEQRARAEQAEQGIAPTWRAKGLGTVTLTDPQPKIAVTRSAAFAEWAAQHHGEHVVASVPVRLPAGDGGAQVAEFVELLDAKGIEHGPVALVVDARWLSGFLPGVAEVDGVVFAPDTGAPIDGVELVPARSGQLQVRLDSEATARAAAEAVDPAALAVYALPVGSLADLLPEAAEGEPEYIETPTRPVTPAAAPVGADVGLAVERADLRAALADRDLGGMRVAALQLHLRDLGLNDKGRKPELLARLSAAVEGER